jgi:hypothetical protein
MFLGVFLVENVNHLNAASFQVICDQASVTPPPERFSTHERSPLCQAQFQQLIYSLLKLLGFHVIGVSAKGSVLPSRILRMKSRPATPTEFGKMEILNSDNLERLGKLRLIEMGIPAGTRKASDIYQRFNPIGVEKLLKLSSRASGVTYGPDTSTHQDSSANVAKLKVFS